MAVRIGAHRCKASLRGGVEVACILGNVLRALFEQIGEVERESARDRVHVMLKRSGRRPSDDVRLLAVPVG